MESSQKTLDISTLLLLSVTYCTAASPDVITVVAGDSNEWLNMKPDSKFVTYRVIMPDRTACPAPSNSTAFDWKVQFWTSHRERDSKICVDFSRLKLTGNSTELMVTPGRQRENYKLTNLRYPLKRSYMSTVRCYDMEQVVALMFHADCNGNLREYFNSWIYVYYQVSSYPVYHLDGSCRHKYEARSSFKQLTVRSYIWKDTVNEPNVQECSLVMSVSIGSYASSSFDRSDLCTKWTFWRTDCGLSVHQKEGYYSLEMREKFDFSGAKNATCQTGYARANLDACLNFRYTFRPAFGVRRIEGYMRNEEIQDGALFFEMKGIVKREEKQTYDFSPPVMETEYEIEDSGSFSSSLFFKTLVPIALLIGVCCCLCGIYRKQSKPVEEQPAAAPYSTPMMQTPEHMRRTPANQQNIAMQPLMGYSGTSHNTYPNSSWAANRREAEVGWTEGRNGTRERSEAAAPPPSYGDVTSDSPRPYVPPQPPQVGDAADVEVPPPPFSTAPSAPPAAPPAYHELFPANN